MRMTFRWLALVVLAAALAVWLARGANRGWTKTSVPIRKLDEVTGIEGIEYQKRFVPGVDFLAGSFIVAGLAGVVSFFFKKPNP